MSRRTRGFLVFGVAIATAGLASAAVHRAVQSGGSTAPDRTRAVLVAARPLPVGAPLTAQDIKTVAWPREAMIDGVLSSPHEVVGRGLTRPLAANEPITSETIAPEGAGSGLPPAIPAGMRAISVKVDDVVGVAGFAVPGSRVDVLVALRGGQDIVARAVASNVQVLAVGTRAEMEGQARTSATSTVVTLLVAPIDAERISLASVQGSITLTLRNPLDVGATSTSGVRLASLVGSSAPPQSAARPVRAVRPVPAPVVPKVHVVETIRAGKRSEESVR